VDAWVRVVRPGVGFLLRPPNGFFT
jgi:hypothetical protein